MAHPLQAHFDHVSALLLKLRTALKDDPEFQCNWKLFDEFLEHNELELALLEVCDPFAERPRSARSTEVLQLIESARQAMGLEDSCYENLWAQ